MSIKKNIVIGLIGLVNIPLGSFLIFELVNAMSKYGIIGYVYIVIFVIGSFWIWKYSRDYKIGLDTINEVVKQSIEEAENHKDFYTGDYIKTNLKDHLINKLNNEEFILFKKK